MHERDRRKVAEELLLRYRGKLHNQLLDDLDRALEVLPESGVWHIPEGDAPVIHLLGEDGPLYTVIIAPETGQVRLMSRTIDGEKMVVGLEWGETVHVRDTERWRETKWTFRFENAEEKGTLGPPSELTGRVRLTPPAGEPDQDESFARVLAGRAGWRVAPRSE